MKTYQNMFDRCGMIYYNTCIHSINIEAECYVERFLIVLEDLVMATNGKSGDNRRHGAVRNRSQTQTASGHWVKRNADTGRFMDVKSDGEKFKGIRKES